MKFSRRTLALTGLAPLALALTACDSSPDDEAALDGEPIAAIAAPDGTSWLETVSVSESNGFILGNPDAPIKLIEYGSLTCGACAGFAAEAVEPLKEKYVSTGVVSYELRNQVHNGIDLVLARMVRCGAPESFHPLSEQVWANLSTILDTANQNGAGIEAAMQLPEDQRFAGVAQAAGLFDFFAARGLSADQATSCLADAEAVQAIGERSTKQSQELNVTSTPTFFINGKNVGNHNWGSLEPMLQRAGAR